MQGTIKSFDPRNRNGVVVDDQRNEYAYDWDSFRDTGMRIFRIGQRVSFVLEGEGARRHVRDLRILTVRPA